jgi:hypothetical protein
MVKLPAGIDTIPSGAWQKQDVLAMMETRIVSNFINTSFLFPADLADLPAGRQVCVISGKIVF